MKKLIALLVALALLVGGWWYASPLIALDGLRDAAETGNTAELEERVDFPALRESVKEQMRAALSDAARGEGGDGLGALGASLGLVVVDPIVDGLVTPEWVARTVVEGQRRQVQAEAMRRTLPRREPAGPDTPGTSEPRTADEPGPSAEPKFDIHREGFGTFRVTTSAPSGEAGPTLLFARDGLGWDLVGVELPVADMLQVR